MYMVFRLNRYMYVYLITNLVNGKKYVGQTVQNPERRWARHKRNCVNGYPYHIYNAMRKHGIENFQFELIDECVCSEELFESEIRWIEHYDTFKGVGYNMTSGGMSPMLGRTHTEESKRKMSKDRSGKLNPFYGKKHTEESKRKMSLGVSEVSTLKKPVTQCDLNGNEIKQHESARKASIELSIDASAIGKVCKGKQKTAGGFSWRYLDVSI